MTVDIDALLAKYPPKPVGLYGNCMVIPTKEFDSMWEAELCDSPLLPSSETSSEDPACSSGLSLLSLLLK